MSDELNQVSAAEAGTQTDNGVSQSTVDQTHNTVTAAPADTTQVVEVVPTTDAVLELAPQTGIVVRNDVSVIDTTTNTPSVYASVTEVQAEVQPQPEAIDGSVEQPAQDANPINLVDPNAEFVGLMCAGSTDSFWNITCPCGVVVSYGINGFPTVDTPHTCGNPNHWTIKFRPAPGEPQTVSTPTVDAALQLPDDAQTATIGRAVQWQPAPLFRYVFPAMPQSLKEGAPELYAAEVKRTAILQQLWFDSYGTQVDQEFRDVPYIEFADWNQRNKVQ